MKKLKKIILQTLLYTICWRNVDKLTRVWIYAKYNLLKKGRKMEKELKKIGIKLAKLAKKHNECYLTLSYVDGEIIGNADPQKPECMSIYINNKKVEKLIKEEE